MAKKPRVLQDKHLHVAPVVGDEPVRRSETAPLAEYLAEPVAWPTWLRAAPILGAALLAVASTTANNPTQPTVVQGALLVSLLALPADGGGFAVRHYPVAVQDSPHANHCTHLRGWR